MNIDGLTTKTTPTTTTPGTATTTTTPTTNKKNKKDNNNANIKINNTSSTTATTTATNTNTDQSLSQPQPLVKKRSSLILSTTNLALSIHLLIIHTDHFDTFQVFLLLSLVILVRVYFNTYFPTITHHYSFFTILLSVSLSYTNTLYNQSLHYLDMPNTPPHGWGRVDKPIPVLFNVSNHHIKKTPDKKGFLLGNTIVTNLYATSTCLITDVKSVKDNPNRLGVTFDDGTGVFTYSNLGKSDFPATIWSKLNIPITTSSTTESTPSNDSKSIAYKQSSNYPLMVKFTFKLTINDGRDYSSCTWHSCELFDHGLSTPISQDSQEWCNIVRKENIDQGIAFYKEYCLTDEQKATLTVLNSSNITSAGYGNLTQQLQPSPSPSPSNVFHPIFDNPYHIIPLTIENMLLDTSVIMMQHPSQQQTSQWDNNTAQNTNTTSTASPPPSPKLMYYGKDITNRLAYLTTYVLDNTKPCPNTPQCSVDCKHVDFTDNTSSLFSHMSKPPQQNSTYVDLCRLYVDSTEETHTVGRRTRTRCAVGKEGYKDQLLIDQHEKNANKLSFELQSNQYYGNSNAFIQYQHHIEQLNVCFNTIKYRLTSPLFIPLLQPIQDKLESMIQFKYKDPYSKKQATLFRSPHWSETIDYMSKTQKIIDILSNLNPSLYNSFYEDYIPFIKQRIESLQQQMQCKDEQQLQQSHNSTSLLSYQSNVTHSNYNIFHKKSHLASPHIDTLSLVLDLSPYQQLECFQQSDSTPEERLNNKNTVLCRYNAILHHSSRVAQCCVDINDAKETALYNAIGKHESTIEEKDKIIEQQQTTIQHKDDQIVKIIQQYENNITTLKEEIVSLKKVEDIKDSYNDIILQKDNSILNTNNNVITTLNNQITILEKQLDNINTQHVAQLQAKDAQLQAKDEQHAAQLQAKDKQIELLMQMLAASTNISTTHNKQ